MKWLLSLLTVAALFSACQPDSELPPPAPTPQQMVLGKWMLQQTKSEYYMPIPVLVSSDVENGTPADSLIFKSNGTILSYVGTPVPDTIPYRVINSSTIEMDGNKYQIKELTANKFRVYLDSTNTTFNMRLVVDVNLVR